MAIGIDLGGTNIKGVILNQEGEILHQVVKPTLEKTGQKESGEKWKAAVAETVFELKSKGSASNEPVGIAAPGLPNESNTAIRVMPQRLKGLEQFVWSDYLNERKVSVINDAHAALMAEAKFGVGKGTKNIVMLTLGTGVGGAVFIEGKLYQGSFQMAGHVGHTVIDSDKEDPGITGAPGSLESAIGDATVCKRSFGRFQSTRELVEAHKSGDSFATYVWLNALRKLALSLTSLCNLLSPDLIILGGGITKAGDALYDPLFEFMNVFEWKNTGKGTPVMQAQYREMAGAVGAAGFAQEQWKL